MTKQQPMSPWVRRAMGHTLPVAVDGGRPADPAGVIHVLSRAARGVATGPESRASREVERDTTD